MHKIFSRFILLSMAMYLHAGAAHHTDRPRQATPASIPPRPAPLGTRSTLETKTMSNGGIPSRAKVLPLQKSPRFS
jgi:hypothetical protein